jgi:hypothetical protein
MPHSVGWVLLIMPTIACGHLNASTQATGHSGAQSRQRSIINCPRGTIRKSSDEAGEEGVWCERPNGRRHGPAIRFHPGTKNVFERGAYLDGARHGAWVWYAEDGSQEGKRQYYRGQSSGLILRVLIKGHPQFGAIVTIDSPSWNVQFTDQRGEILISSITSGVFVAIIKYGRRTAKRSFQIREGQLTLVEQNFP